MTETPREYKKRIDSEWQKRRKNRDKLIKQIEKYELVDEDYKARTKQEILLSFEKNEKAEKNDELYTKIGEELESIEIKYQELEQLKRKLKKKEEKKLKLEMKLRAQKIDGSDETTLMIQMNEMEKDKQNLEKMEKEIDEIKKEIENRKDELKGIEETYGKKEKEIEVIDDEKDIEESQPEEEITEKPNTLEEYKTNILRERGKIDRTKLEIIKLLDEGTGIDESMKEKIKGEISSVFDEYESEQEGTLRMKSARYIKKRDDIFKAIDESIKWGDVGGKPAFRVKKDGKYFIMRGKEKYGGDFDRVGNPVDIGGKPAFRACKDSKYLLMRGNKQCGELFDFTLDLVDIGGKPVFTASKDGKQFLMRGNKQCGELFDRVGNPVNIGGKPAFRAKKDGKYCVVRGNKQYSEWFDDISDLQDNGGKPIYTVKENGYKEVYSCKTKINILGGYGFLIGGKPVYKEGKLGKVCIMRGGKQCGELFDRVGNLVDIGGKPAFLAEKHGKRCVVRGKEQCGENFDNVDNLVDIGGKPVFRVKRNGKCFVMQGKEKYSEYFDDVDNLKNIGGKPVFTVKKNGKYSIMRGKEKSGGDFDQVRVPIGIGGKPVFIALKDGKYFVMRGNEQCGEDFDDVDNLEDVGGKPAFLAEKHGKRCVMRGNEQCGGDFDSVGFPIDISGKPAFIARKDGKYFVMRGNEQCGEDFDDVDNLVSFGGKPKFKARKNGKGCIMRGNEQGLSSYDWQHGKKENPATESETLRDKREKIILQRYNKKQNRDEVIKIIMGSDDIDQKIKKQLESEILRDFSAQFEKVTSDGVYQKMDKEYRLLKKIGREYRKKSVEVEKKKDESKQEIIEIDGKLYEIGKSAMKLEDGSRWKKWKLRRTVDEWDELETRQKKILGDIYKLMDEKRKLELSLSNHNKKYGEQGKGKMIRQRYRPVMRPDKLDRYKGVDKRKLGSEKTLKGYKETYIKIVQEKENKLKDLLQQIENLDIGVSDEVKNKIIEQLRWALMKEIEKIKEGDDLIKMANEIEEYLDKNLESIREKLEQLDKEIEKKKEEIQELQRKETGVSVDELMKIRKEEFDKNKELIRLQEEYKRIKSDLDEKLIKYQGEE